MSDEFTPPDMTQINFTLQHGERTTDRMVEGVLKALREAMPKTIEYNGKNCDVVPLGDVRQSNQHGTVFTFDVKKPDDTFEHIEFTVIKTGWERGFSHE